MIAISRYLQGAAILTDYKGQWVPHACAQCRLIGVRCIGNCLYPSSKGISPAKLKWRPCVYVFLASSRDARGLKRETKVMRSERISRGAIISFLCSPFWCVSVSVDSRDYISTWRILSHVDDNTTHTTVDNNLSSLRPSLHNWCMMGRSWYILWDQL